MFEVLFGFKMVRFYPWEGQAEAIVIYAELESILYVVKSVIRTI